MVVRVAVIRNCSLGICPSDCLTVSIGNQSVPSFLSKLKHNPFEFRSRGW